ncbi:alkaline phosphatase D domain protein [Lentisphaera araneosa HTCC2155]|uniref:Alkaline phosphatase D domain protein n=1 Tax=Lentisphaera araneosa HTCC2155 TaxID=313628 RepID=A6DI23_9BACT|nr:alkaline phosphatase D family protein [Lentisphaera araneosa]EDM28677.1 alkaline phosphatase D domain protein [Lentisphaera araneosa HTCC2155]
MKHLITFILILGIPCVSTFASTQSISTNVDHYYEVEKLPQSIGFGSCAKEFKPQPILKTIADMNPDLFIYLGDNIYADYLNKKQYRGTPERPYVDGKDLQHMKAKYAQLAKKKEFIHLKKTTKLIATWDDHDYGANDSGKEYPYKEQSKKIFLDFWEEPSDSKRRQREGIHTSYYYKNGNNSLQILLLDTRTFRDLLNTKNGKVSPHTDPKKSILGKTQWSWLENQLNLPATRRIICTSIQFGHQFNGYESWTNFPHEKQKMLDLIEKTKVKNITFISGDVHWGEISKIKEGLYDITASGLTETWYKTSPNKFRVGKAMKEHHFGWCEFNWETKSVTFQLRNKKSKVVNELIIPSL